MPTPAKGPRLGGSPAHERLILANLATSLFEHGKITTTETKAKRLRPHAEKLITTAKKGTLHARREVMKTVRDKDVVHKLFAEIGPSFATRNGGYTRIIKTAPRKGDNAPMAIIELVDEETVTSAASRVDPARRHRPQRRPQRPRGRLHRCRGRHRCRRGRTGSRERLRAGHRGRLRGSGRGCGRRGGRRGPRLRPRTLRIARAAPSRPSRLRPRIRPKAPTRRSSFMHCDEAVGGRRRFGPATSARPRSVTSVSRD